MLLQYVHSPILTRVTHVDGASPHQREPHSNHNERDGQQVTIQAIFAIQAKHDTIFLPPLNPTVEEALKSTLRAGCGEMR